jgi:hypothetical protein
MRLSPNGHRIYAMAICFVYESSLSSILKGSFGRKARADFCLKTMMNSQSIKAAAPTTTLTGATRLNSTGAVTSFLCARFIAR